MTASEIIQDTMQNNGISLIQLAENANLGTRQNVSQLLKQKDLKVSTFVKMLDALDCQLIVQDVNSNEDIIVDYD